MLLSGVASALAVLTLFAASPADEPGFRRLFDGKTLKGWKLVDGKGSGYIVENGILVCPADGGGKLLSEEEFANFVLRLEYRLSPAGNNGINIRAPYEGRPAYVGMEIQILDNDAPKWKSVRPEQLNSSIYDVLPAKQGFQKKPGEWNYLEITANGRKIVVKLNDATVVDANLDDIRDPAVLEKHPGLARTTGHIGFLGHATRCEFRNVRIKPLP
jgi:hypothetical protein